MYSRKLSVAIIVTACLFLKLGTWADAKDTGSRFIVSGASATAPAVDKELKAYKKAFPNCAGALVVASSGKGIRQFLAGKADIGMATRDLNEKEDKKAQEAGIAIAKRKFGDIGLGVIVSADNPVTELTMDQMRDIFSGKITNWKDVGGPDKPIKVLTREVPTRGSGVLFQKLVLGGAPYSKGSVIAQRWSNMAAGCAKGWAIGYMHTMSKFAKDPNAFGIKFLQFKKDKDSPAVQPFDPSYPVVMPFNLFWKKGTKNKCITGFVDFVGDAAKAGKIKGLAVSK
jgi:phosphate transport system substrate-binding protein